MGLVDAFSAEEKFTMKFSEFYAIVREAAKNEFITNAVFCDVPHEYIKKMITGDPNAGITIIEEKAE